MKQSKEKKELLEKYTIDKKDLVPTAKTNTGRFLEYDKLRALVESNASKISDSKGIMDLLPDLYLVREVLIASVLSPKDLTTVDLNIKISTKQNESAPPAMAECIRKHFSSVYDLNGKQAEILGEALFDIGSYSLLCIPASSIGKMINDNSVALEDVGSDILDGNVLPNIGLLGNNNHIGLEGLSNAILGNNTDIANPLIEITDNCLYLANPTLQNSNRINNTNSLLSDYLGIESIDKPTDNNEVYLNRAVRETPEVSLGNYVSKDSDRRSNLNPIVLNLPAESVIPVSIPGEPENHVGYYVITDSRGNPLHIKNDKSHFIELHNRLKQTIAEDNNNVVTSSLGISTDVKSTDDFVAPMLSAYVANLELELKEAVMNGVHGAEVDINAVDSIYRLMFSRQLARQRTKVIYVPKEMLTYIAFNYNDLGIGVSLLEKTKLYASLRAVLLFAKMMAGIKNSVASKVLNITLDSDDPDPQVTVETILQEFTRLQTTGLPIGYLSPTDIVDALQKSGVQIKIDGGDFYPGTKIDIDDTNRDVSKPDTDLSDELRHAHYAGLWVSPETIDNTLEGDFATSVVARNLLQAKRVLVCQRKFTDKISTFIKRYIFTKGPLLDELTEIYNDNKITNISLHELINSITVHYPEPDNVVLNAQMDSYKAYSDFIDDTIELYVTDDMISDLLEGEHVSKGVETIKFSVANLLKRNYLRQQNMLPELDGMFIDTETDTADSISSHNDTVVKLIANVIKKVIKVEHRNDAVIQKVVDKLDEPKEDVGTPESNTDATDATQTDNAPNDTTDTTDNILDV